MLIFLQQLIKWLLPTLWWCWYYVQSQLRDGKAEKLHGGPAVSRAPKSKPLKMKKVKPKIPVVHRLEGTKMMK